MTTCLNSNDTLPQEILEILLNQGTEGLSKVVTVLINQAMRLERERYLQAKPYERNEERTTYANGYKDRTLHTRLGKLELSVPQTRDGKFYPESLDKGLRSERALKAALAEMYIQGVSTRKVAKITEVLCGFEISSSEVSRMTAALDEELKQWRERPLGSYPFVFLDARYEKVRHAGAVVELAVLMAIGVTQGGVREVLGV
jgi:putative transposase